MGMNTNTLSDRDRRNKRLNDMMNNGLNYMMNIGSNFLIIFAFP